MDEENSEFDISESWSLVDINLNEESLTTTDAPLTLESHSNDLKKLRRKSETELQDFLEKSNELSKNNFSQLGDSDFDSSLKKQDVKGYREAKEIHSFENLDDDEKNDSGDAESIEILDVDENYEDSEIDRVDVSVTDHFDFSTYQSDDEESSGGKLQNENGSSYLAVIKRKRKIVSRDVADTANFVHSENVNMNEKFRTNNHPVYKHYRNNVANTILNLSVGVIFAGVACLAVGHFLGVQDAAETTVELVETLKKLQRENAALQTSMANLKTALLSLETNSKLELPLSQQHNKLSCEEAPKISPLNTQTQADLDKVALSEIYSSLNSIKWLSKLQNAVKKGTETEHTEIDIKRLEKHIHDQFNLIKERRKIQAKLSEETDLLLIINTLLIIVKKILNRLSSQDHIEGMQEKFLQLKHTINHNLNNFFRDSSREMQRENKVPVTEFDLKTIHWKPGDKIRRDSEDDSRVLYKFPQPQKYYDVETRLEEKNSNRSLKNEDDENLIRNKKKHEENKKKEKKLGKKLKKRKEMKDKKKDKKRRRALTEKCDKKESGFVKYANLSRFNESDSSYKKKLEKKFKHKKRKLKSSKLKRILFSSFKKESNLKKKYVPFCSDSQCFNVTGYWVFKLAGGREEYRRHQTLGDWQFDRAKARKHERNIQLNNNWQFERAKARKELRILAGIGSLGGLWQGKTPEMTGNIRRNS